MFTGIIEEIGRVRAIKRGAKSSSLSLQGNIVCEALRIGDSVAVNGVCLTVTSCRENLFTADVMHETLNRSTLGSLKTGSSVNLERALPANGRFGGHIVSGHIDGTGIITKITKDDNAVWYTIKANDKIMKYIVEKGSIALDGVSLTVAGLTSNSFSVSVIPHTAQATIFSEKSLGDAVNLENDIIGKYVEKLLGQGQTIKPHSNITKEFLFTAGY